MVKKPAMLMAVAGGILLAGPEPAAAAKWYPWERIGGTIFEEPSCVSWGAGRIDCFARGTSNGVYHRAWTGSSWTTWRFLGGDLKSGPDCVSWERGRIDCFAIGGDSRSGTSGAMAAAGAAGKTWAAVCRRTSTACRTRPTARAGGRSGSIASFAASTRRCTTDGSTAAGVAGRTCRGSSAPHRNVLAGGRAGSTASPRPRRRALPPLLRLARVAMEVAHPEPSREVVGTTPAPSMRSRRMGVHQNIRPYRSIADGPPALDCR